MRSKNIFHLISTTGLLAVLMVSLFSCGEKTRVKNVIYLIGDGMGPQALGLLNSYVKYAPHSIYKSRGRVSALEKAMTEGTVGLAYCEGKDTLVPDSAVSGTQMATGHWSRSGLVGLDYNGRSVETILEKAKKMGKSTGLLSDARLTHATPACFASHQPLRYLENRIAEDMLNTGVDVMLSGGLRHFIPMSASDPASTAHARFTKLTKGTIKIVSKRKDEKDLIQAAANKGYDVVFSAQQLKRSPSGQILGLFSDSGMQDAIRERQDKDSPRRTCPTLLEMTEKALTVLSKNRKGFFLMVEAGQIDWAGHDNDAGQLLHEMVRFDDVVACVMNWAANRDDTLVIITADHETGGFAFSYGRRNPPGPMKLPGPLFQNRPYQAVANFGHYELLDRIWAQKASFHTIMQKYGKLPKTQKTPAALRKIINAHIDFPISLTEAKNILATEENEYYIKKRKGYDRPRYPRVHDFKEYYTSGINVRKALIGRQIAKYQQVAWSSGSHTHTPIPLITLGPAAVTRKFGGLLHTTEWAKLAIAAME